MTRNNNNDLSFEQRSKKTRTIPLPSGNTTTANNSAPGTTRLTRDTSSSSRHTQVASSCSDNIAKASVLAQHDTNIDSNATTLISNGISLLLSLIAVVFGKMLLPLLYPGYKWIARKLGWTVDESMHIPNDNIWHRSFRTAALFATNVVMIAGSIAACIQVGRTGADSSIIDDITVSTLITAVITGVLVGAVVSVWQYFHDRDNIKKRKERPESQITSPADHIITDTWSKRLKTGMVVGNQVGLLIGFAIAASTLGVVDKLPLANACINTLCTVIGGVTGGIIALIAGPMLTALDQYLKHFSWYQNPRTKITGMASWIYNKLASMANSNNVNNPASNRIKAGLQLGGSIGAIAGFCLGSLIPGPGTVIGMGLGAAIGSLVGAGAGYVAEPVLTYFKDASVKELGSANPWSNRMRCGGILGASAGLIVSCFFPPAALFIIPLCSLAGALVFTAIEPCQVYILTSVHGERIRDDKNLLQDSTGNPWTARLPIGCMTGAAIGGIIGFAAGGPAGIALGLGIGGTVGGLLGCAFTNNIRARLLSLVSPLYQKVYHKVEKLCSENRAEVEVEVKVKRENDSDNRKIQPSPSSLSLSPQPKALTPPPQTPSTPADFNYHSGSLMQKSIFKPRQITLETDLNPRKPVVATRSNGY